LLFDPAFSIGRVDDAGIRVNNSATGWQIHE
jgi:hypothetical protein